MSFNISSTSSSIWSDFEAEYGEPGSEQPDLSTTWADIFAKGYDDHATNGTMSTTAVKLTSMKSHLYFSNTSNSTNAAVTLGLAVAKYWTLQITPGVPMAGVAVGPIVNDAVKIGPLITADLIALGQTGPLTPYYNQLITIIDKHVKTIVWTVTEILPAGTNTYPAAVS